ncbi:hypothetical protein [Stenotrophomonas maltophilia]|uniref:hypothetical protein n=1 Tax=Stenotrophomonas maltophilia TaxID=40324 RepID=UPI0013D9EA6A|nr:hypothetical protein [Stenotrophomonas maltophilia]
MKYGLIGLIALSVTGAARADALLCEGVFFSGGEPSKATYTVVLDRAKLTLRMPSDIGWVEGKLDVSPDRYTGHLSSKDGTTRAVTLERFTGELRLMDPASSRMIYTGTCEAAKARF